MPVKIGSFQVQIPVRAHVDYHCFQTDGLIGNIRISSLIFFCASCLDIHLSAYGISSAWDYFKCLKKLCKNWICSSSFNRSYALTVSNGRHQKQVKIYFNRIFCK